MALRSTFAGLNTMYRGVTTNRLSLETTGHNMTNSNVDGYSRQSVNQAAVMPDTIYAYGNRQFVEQIYKTLRKLDNSLWRKDRKSLTLRQQTFKEL